MRKWHRWITVFFGVFMLWMAFTGVASHVTALWPAGETAGPPPVPQGFVWISYRKMLSIKWWQCWILAPL